MTDLTGKVALVTGAGRHRGLGRAMALRLAEDGANLVVTGLHRAPSEQPQSEQAMGWTGVASLAAEIEAMGRQALAFECDLTDKASVAELVQAARDKFGRIDILVNNAAVPSGAGDSPILDMDDELWYRTVDINLNSVYLVTKAVGQFLKTKGTLTVEAAPTEPVPIMNVVMTGQADPTKIPEMINLQISAD